MGGLTNHHYELASRLSSSGYNPEFVFPETSLRSLTTTWPKLTTYLTDSSLSTFPLIIVVGEEISRANERSSVDARLAAQVFRIASQIIGADQPLPEDASKIFAENYWDLYERS